MTQADDNRIVVSDPLARRLMVRYLENRRDDVERLRAALARDDFDHIRDKGHNLYGSGSAYGLDQVSELGAALEKSAGKQDSEEIVRLIQSLEAFVRNVRVV